MPRASVYLADFMMPYARRQEPERGEQLSAACLGPQRRPARRRDDIAAGCRIDNVMTPALSYYLNHGIIGIAVNDDAASEWQRRPIATKPLVGVPATAASLLAAMSLANRSRSLAKLNGDMIPATSCLLQCAWRSLDGDDDSRRA